MIKFTKEEFIEELKSEMSGYEEITEKDIKVFVKYFENYILKEKGKHKKIIQNGNNITIQLTDESEIFGIVDEYYAAVATEETELFFAGWKL